MARKHVFADEAGNFDFSRKGSRYFVLTTITVDDFTIGDELQQLRRDLGWRGVELRGEFHATTDSQAVRNEVYAVIARHDFRIDATILEKAKAMTHLQQDEIRFYQTAWFLHMKYVAPRITTQDDELFVVGASLGTRAKQDSFHKAIFEVVGQTAHTTQFKTAAWSAACEPCLQVADYCCWAIQRKWERNDSRSYDLIRDRIVSEFDVFRRGAKNTDQLWS